MMGRAKRVNPEFCYRTVAVAGRASAPASFDAAARTVEVVAATENPVPMWSWEYGTIDEVLLMKGVQFPASRQIPLLDTHSRFSAADVLGSARDLRTEQDQLLATAAFSSVTAAEEVFRKIEEGHITDVSIGYRVNDAVTVPEGEKAVIAGRTWQGPVKVATSWSAKELSVVPIGADEAAKARAEGHSLRVSADAFDVALLEETSGMDRALRAYLERAGLPTHATEWEAWQFYLMHSRTHRQECRP